MKKARIIYLIIGLLTAGIAFSQDVKLKSTTTNISWVLIDVSTSVNKEEPIENTNYVKQLMAFSSNESLK